KPGVAFPLQKVENSEIIRRVRAQFRGDEHTWSSVESGIEKVFSLCNTRTRYLEDDLEARVANYAADAVTVCLENNDTDLSEIDLLIHGGIPRQYFEPATAMEVADTLGIRSGHALDVTAA